MTDVRILVALSLYQSCGSRQPRAGNGYLGGMLMTMALLLAFAPGKTLGARRDTAD
jgi:hypothetical protein